jgi:hypothetical protein
MSPGGQGKDRKRHAVTMWNLTAGLAPYMRPDVQKNTLRTLETDAQSEGAGVSILYRLLSSIKTPITNTTKAIPNNAISIKVMTLTVYLPTLDLRAR